jgi:uncharacterized membrane protein YbjE (DUF340 family)
MVQRSALVETMFDLMAVLLFIAAASLFFLRFRHENPPLSPYILIALVCAVGNWLGNHGGGAAAFMLLIAASFFLLHLAGEPYRDEPEDQRR